MMGTLEFIILTVLTVTLLNVAQVNSRHTQGVDGLKSSSFNKDYYALQEILGKNLAGTTKEKTKVVDLLLQLLEEIDLPTLCEVILNDTNGNKNEFLQVPIKATKLDTDLLKSMMAELQESAGSIKQVMEENFLPRKTTSVDGSYANTKSPQYKEFDPENKKAQVTRQYLRKDENSVNNLHGYWPSLQNSRFEGVKLRTLDDYNIINKKTKIDKPRTQVYSKSLILGDWLSDKSKFNLKNQESYIKHPAELLEEDITNSENEVTDLNELSSDDQYKSKKSGKNKIQSKKHKQISFEWNKKYKSMFPRTTSKIDLENFNSETSLGGQREVDYLQELRSTLKSDQTITTGPKIKTSQRVKDEFDDDVTGLPDSNGPSDIYPEQEVKTTVASLRKAFRSDTAENSTPNRHRKLITPLKYTNIDDLLNNQDEISRGNPTWLITRSPAHVSSRQDFATTQVLRRDQARKNSANTKLSKYIPKANEDSTYNVNDLQTQQKSYKFIKEDATLLRLPHKLTEIVGNLRDRVSRPSDGDNMTISELGPTDGTTPKQIFNEPQAPSGDRLVRQKISATRSSDQSSGLVEMNKDQTVTSLKKGISYTRKPEVKSQGIINEGSMLTTQTSNDDNNKTTTTSATLLSTPTTNPKEEINSTVLTSKVVVGPSTTDSGSTISTKINNGFKSKKNKKLKGINSKSKTGETVLNIKNKNKHRKVERKNFAKNADSSLRSNQTQETNQTIKIENGRESPQSFNKLQGTKSNKTSGNSSSSREGSEMQESFSTSWQFKGQESITTENGASGKGGLGSHTVTTDTSRVSAALLVTNEPKMHQQNNASTTSVKVLINTTNVSPISKSVSTSEPEIHSYSNTNVEDLQSTISPSIKHLLISETTEIDKTHSYESTDASWDVEDETVTPTTSTFPATPEEIVQQAADYDNFIKPMYIDYGDKRLHFESSTEAERDDQTPTAQTNFVSDSEMDQTDSLETQSVASQQKKIRAQTADNFTQAEWITPMSADIPTSFQYRDFNESTSSEENVVIVTRNPTLSDSLMQQSSRRNITIDNLKTISSKIAETKAKLSKININLQNATNRRSQQVHAAFGEGKNGEADIILKEIEQLPDDAQMPTSLLESNDQMATLTNASDTPHEAASNYNKESTESGVSQPTQAPAESLETETQPLVSISNVPKEVQETVVNDGLSFSTREALTTADLSEKINHTSSISLLDTSTTFTSIPPDTNKVIQQSKLYVPGTLSNVNKSQYASKNIYRNKPVSRPYNFQLYKTESSATNQQQAPIMHPWKAYNIALSKSKSRQSSKANVPTGVPEIHLYSDYKLASIPADNLLNNYLWKARPWPEHESNKETQSMTYNKLLTEESGLNKRKDNKEGDSLIYQTKLAEKIHNLKNQAEKIKHAKIWGKRFSQGYYGRVFDDQKNTLKPGESDSWSTFHSQDMVNFDILDETQQGLRENVPVYNPKIKQNLTQKQQLKPLNNSSVKELEQPKDTLVDFPLYSGGKLNQGTQNSENERNVEGHTDDPAEIPANSEVINRSRNGTSEILLTDDKMTKNFKRVSSRGIPASADYKCPGLFGYHRDPQDCQAFFICSWGMAHRVVCPPGTLYNAKEAVCDWAINVRCSVSHYTAKTISF